MALPSRPGTEPAEEFVDVQLSWLENAAVAELFRLCEQLHYPYDYNWSRGQTVAFLLRCAVEG